MPPHNRILFWLFGYYGFECPEWEGGELHELRFQVLDNYGKNTDTHSEYVLLVHGNKLHVCATILRYMYVALLGLLVTVYQDSSR